MVAYRDIDFAPAEADFQQRPDGTWIVTCPTPLGPYPTRFTEYLEHWAHVAPDRVFLAQRTKEGPWRRVTYADMWGRVQACAQALLDRGLSPEQPVAILSGNDIEQQVLGLAAMHVGIPVAPVSPSYALLATDYAKLRHVLGLVTPGLVFANDGARFAPALRAVLPPHAELVVTENPPPDRPATRFEDLTATVPTQAVAEAAARVTSRTVAKLLFTSGSTGTPKGVINTHGMMCSNVQMIRQCWRFLTQTPPVMVDWLPWNHTAGGNHDFGTVYANGGTFYIDDGRPTPSGLAETLRNLREISPTIYISMPRGFEDLLPHLKQDRALRERFFKDLQLIFYAGAALPAHLWEEYDALAEAAIGERILMMTGLGSTETGPFAIGSNKQYRGAGMVGLPAPGVTLKLVPNSGKLELRLKSPSITEGYWRQPELTEAAFDEEGFYCMRDAVRFADPHNKLAGFVFDGRINEDFKLTTGTWVSVGALRTQLIAQFAPLIRDVVIAGHNRDFIALLLLPDRNVLRDLSPEMVRTAFQEKLDAHAVAATGSSMRALRCLVLEGELSMDRGELTDKGSINQRAVLESRTELVEALYAQTPEARIIRATIEGKVN
jgi:feruloyl-CoA synthase